jgi:hypothetical protein
LKYCFERGLGVLISTPACCRKSSSPESDHHGFAVTGASPYHGPDLARSAPGAARLPIAFRTCARCARPVSLHPRNRRRSRAGPEVLRLSNFCDPLDKSAPVSYPTGIVPVFFQFPAAIYSKLRKSCLMVRSTLPASEHQRALDWDRIAAKSRGHEYLYAALFREMMLPLPAPQATRPKASTPRKFPPCPSERKKSTLFPYSVAWFPRFLAGSRSKIGQYLLSRLCSATGRSIHTGKSLTVVLLYEALPPMGSVTHTSLSIGSTCIT